MTEFCGSCGYSAGSHNQERGGTKCCLSPGCKCDNFVPESESQKRKEIRRTDLERNSIQIKGRRC